MRLGQYSRNHSLDSIAEMVAIAASALSQTSLAIGTEAGLSIQSAATKVQRCGLLLSPHLRPRHPFLLAASTSSTRQMHSPSPKRSSTSSASNASYALRWPRRVRGSLPQHPRSPQAPPPRRIAETLARPLVPAGVRAILDACWPTLLAALSFLLLTNLSGPLFDSILSALRALACVAGCLALPTPHGGFLTPFAKVAFPPHVVAAINGPPQAQHAPRSPFSLEGLTLGLADSGREAEAAPDRARAIWRACARSSLLRYF